MEGNGLKIIYEVPSFASGEVYNSHKVENCCCLVSNHMFGSFTRHVSLEVDNQHGL